MRIDPHIEIEDEQIGLLEKWLQANKEMKIGWINGYGLGKAYVDARVKSRSKTDERNRYVALDTLTASKVPQLVGHTASEISSFLLEREAMKDVSSLSM